MRKNEILRQNVALFDQLQKSNAENARLKEQISSLEKDVSQLKQQLETRAKPAGTPSFMRLQRRMSDQNVVAVSPDMEYGSQVIGKIVVAAAEYSNRLTSGGDVSCRELVNLILGRTEVAKAEILSIISSDASLEEKQAQIDRQLETAKEYFESVMAQRA